MKTTLNERPIEVTLPLVVLIVLICFSTPRLVAQERTVAGRVFSAERGDALAGVSVLLKGTTRGTVTDLEGKFALGISSESGILVFSFLGSARQEIEINGRNFIDVSLAEEPTQLKEVVITALALSKDRDKVGASSTQVSGESIKGSGEPTMLNGMSGKSSGLIINRGTGDPGAGSYIQIRGQSSISSIYQPLIVVDGTPAYNSAIGWAWVPEQSRINDINPADIESVEVLKGASASALWGSLGANGVIMITTKKGKPADGMKISYSGSYSFDKILAKHPMQKRWGQGILGYYRTNVHATSAQILTFGDKISNRPGGADVLLNDPSSPAYNGYFRTHEDKIIYPIVESDFSTPNGGKNSRTVYDPYDAVYHTGRTIDHTISISDADTKGSYYLSMAHLDQDGIAKSNSGYRRTSFRLNTARKLSDWFSVSVNSMYARIVQNRIQQSYSVNNSLPIGLLRTPPDWNNAIGYKGTYYDRDGNGFPYRQLTYRNQYGRFASFTNDSPFWVMNENLDEARTNRLMETLQFDLKAARWLTITLRGGFDHYTDQKSNMKSVGSTGAAAAFGSLSLIQLQETKINADAFATINFSSEKLGFTGLVGLNANEDKYEIIAGEASNFIIREDPPVSLSNALSGNRVPGNNFSVLRSAALYATADVSYSDQLFLSLTARAENSSAFSHKNNPVFFYPSATLSWHVLKALRTQRTDFSFLKLRAGYGVVAVAPQPYQTYSVWETAIYRDGSNVLDASSPQYGGGYAQSRTMPNRNLKPEFKKEAEIGFDARILNDQINIGATYFANQVDGLVLNVLTPGSTGFTNRLANAAQLTNRGIEVDVSGRIFHHRDFAVDIIGTWTRIRNKITDLAGAEMLTVFGNGGAINAVRGKPVGLLWGYGYERDSTETLVLNEQTGFPQLSSSRRVLGDPNPDWRGSLGFTLSYKNFSLNVFAEHSHGGDMLAETRANMVGFGTHKDTDREVTLTASEAATYRNFLGNTAVTQGYLANSDGTYTVRGYLRDFGAGTVLIDEMWWRGLGGGGSYSTNARESYIETAEWTKLREITLKYRFSGERLRKLTRLAWLDFGVTGRNLFLWTKFQGNDPETNFGTDLNQRGLDIYNNPATRSILFSVVINY